MTDTIETINIDAAARWARVIEGVVRDEPEAFGVLERHLGVHIDNKYVMATEISADVADRKRTNRFPLFLGTRSGRWMYCSIAQAASKKWYVMGRYLARATSAPEWPR